MKNEINEKEWIQEIANYVQDSAGIGMKINKLIEGNKLSPELLEVFGIESGNEDEEYVVENLKKIVEGTATVFSNGIFLFPAF